jgi:hypothetical protein
MDNLTHPFDFEMDSTESIDLFVEELPDQNQMIFTNCTNCISSFSTASGVCLATVASIVSGGGK